MLQTALCFLVQLGEPFVSTLSSPFIVQFIEATGVTNGDERRLGYYVGLVESSMFLTEGLTVYGWARLSDRIGRKPVLFVGLLILAFATLHLGMSSCYWQILVSRAAQGIANGNIGVIKTVMAEISTPTTAAYVFSMIPIAWAVGTAIGPILGGALVLPLSHPYFLPCAVAATLVFIIAIFFHISFKETLDSCDSLDQLEPLLPKEEKKMYSQPVVLTIAVSALTAFTIQATMCLLPLFYATSPQFGGLGLSPYQIGLLLGISGMIKGAVQLALFPACIHRWGSRSVYMFSIASLALVPITSIIISFQPTSNLVKWSCITLQLIGFGAISFAYGSLYIYFTLLVPPSSIASLNGLVQMVGTVNKALAPAVITSLYSYSLQMGSMSVHSFLFGCIALNVLGACCVPIL